MDPIIEEDPSGSTEQTAGLGRQNSMLSPQPMMTTTTGTEWPTPLFRGASQAQEKFLNAFVIQDHTVQKMELTQGSPEMLRQFYGKAHRAHSEAMLDRRLELKWENHYGAKDTFDDGLAWQPYRRAVASAKITHK